MILIAYHQVGFGRIDLTQLEQCNESTTASLQRGHQNQKNKIKFLIATLNMCLSALDTFPVFVLS